MQHAHHACRDQWGVRCMRLAATWEAEELFLPPCVAHRLLSSNINYSFNDIERPPFAFRLLMYESTSTIRIRVPTYTHDMEAANNSSINYARPEVMSSSMYVWSMFLVCLLCFSMVNG